MVTTWVSSRRSGDMAGGIRTLRIPLFSDLALSPLVGGIGKNSDCSRAIKECESVAYVHLGHVELSDARAQTKTQYHKDKLVPLLLAQTSRMWLRRGVGELADSTRADANVLSATNRVLLLSRTFTGKQRAGPRVG